jgi:hypothetical protein
MYDRFTYGDARVTSNMPYDGIMNLYTDKLCKSNFLSIDKPYQMNMLSYNSKFRIWEDESPQHSTEETDDNVGGSISDNDGMEIGKINFLAYDGITNVQHVSIIGSAVNSGIHHSGKLDVEVNGETKMTIDEKMISINTQLNVGKFSIHQVGDDKLQLSYAGKILTTISGNGWSADRSSTNIHLSAVVGESTIIWKCKAIKSNSQVILHFDRMIATKFNSKNKMDFYSHIPADYRPYTKHIYVLAHGKLAGNKHTYRIKIYNSGKVKIITDVAINHTLVKINPFSVSYISDADWSDINRALINHKSGIN